MLTLAKHCLFSAAALSSPSSCLNCCAPAWNAWRHFSQNPQIPVTTFTVVAAVSPGLEEQHWEAGASSADLGCWILRSSAGSSSFTALPCGWKVPVELVTATAPVSSSLSLFACFSLESPSVNEPLPICLSSRLAPRSDSLLIISLRNQRWFWHVDFYWHRHHRSLDSISPRNPDVTEGTGPDRSPNQGGCPSAWETGS